MSVLRARMKSGHRAVILNGYWQVPDHPAYWAVPAQAADAIEALVGAGQIEYEPALTRAGDGTFAAPGLQTVQRAPEPAAAAKFSRKK